MQNAELAWSLADAAGDFLSDTQHCTVYVALGAGDLHTAIDQLARVASDNNVPLPEQVVAALNAWNTACAGDDLRHPTPPATTPLAAVGTTIRPTLKLADTYRRRVAGHAEEVATGRLRAATTADNPAATSDR